jgi:hypothetical protein
MGWSIGFDSKWQRDIGYGVPATCDHPGCVQKIDRGLSHVCGNEPYGGDHGCGLYFCSKHLSGPHSRCNQCLKGLPDYKPKPDHPQWIAFKLYDPSWEKWREESPATVAEYEARLDALGTI